MLLGVILLSLAAVVASVHGSGVTIGLAPNSQPIASLYHAQDKYGQYVYGYATPTSTKSESNANGITQGGYSYLDTNGILQTVQYVADRHGFRVAATNLPQDLPEVAYAKAKHLEDYARIASRIVVPYSGPQVLTAVPPQPVQDLPEVAAAKARHLAILNAAYANAAVPPQVVQDLPEVVRARAEHLQIVAQTRARDAAINLSPVEVTNNIVAIRTSPILSSPSVVPVQTRTVSYTPVYGSGYESQYHAQDGLGQYSYGYISPLSSKSEAKTADGVTRGGYSYIDANGLIQTVHYISDPVNGFRVRATNLPVGPQATH